MRSQRYFRLLDALDALVAASPPAGAGGEEAAPVTIDAAYKRVRKAAKRPRRAAPTTRIATRRCTESASAPSDFATPRLPPARKRCPSGPRPSSRCSAIIRTAWSAATHLSQQAEAAHAAGEDTFTYGLLYSAGGRPGAQRSREQLDGALKQLNKAVRKAALRRGRTSWPVSRILFLAAADDHGGAAATIHLDTPSPGASSGLPAGSGEQPSNACAAAPGAAFLALLRVGFA